MEKTLSRKTAITVTATLDAFVTMFETWMENDFVKEKKRLVQKAFSELYPNVDFEQSFSDFKKTLDVHIPKGPEDYKELNMVDYANDLLAGQIPTNGRYDTIPLNTLDNKYGKEVNPFIP